jgi:amino acid adenylation domain-containing protein
MTTAISSNTLSGLLRARAESTPERLAYRFLPDGDAATQELSYAALYARASAVARALTELAPPGERVLVLCPPGLDYIAGLWGCLLANMVAVPSLPPRFNRPSSRFEALLTDTHAKIALVTGSLLLGMRRTRNVDARVSALRFLCVDEFATSTAQADELGTSARSDDLAVLQYTSGSTSSPRGVMLSHAHLIENCQRSIEAASFTASSQLVSWLPPYHDMGLIGTILLSVVVGCHATMMSPFSFVTRPLRWFEAITRYGGTHSGGPDFAFALCTRRITDEQKKSLDLSSWQLAWNGAERVRPETIDAFCNAFAGAGFSRRAMRPCYGLAEAKLIVSFTGDAGPRFFAASEQGLQQHRAQLATSEADTRVLVSSGKVVAGHTACVVDPETRAALPEGDVGELWVSGPSVPYGYFERPDLTERTFQAALQPADGARWLRTGDLGFVHDGEVFVTGRLKDLLIVRGRNFYPDDVEFTAQAAHPACKASSGAAFSVEVSGEERVCLVQEVEGRDLNWEEVASQLRAAVFAEHELVLHDVWLVAPGQVPKTSSGKVQRSAVKARYLAADFEARWRSAPANVALDAPSKLEPLIAGACKELLGLSELDRNEDLFALGAQSVLAMQLAARLEQALGVKVPLRLIFEAPSVARLARALENAEPVTQLPAIQARQNAAAPLSLAQERMWFEHQLDPDSSAYNISGALVLQGTFRRDVLEHALNELVLQHPILRTRYEAREGGPLQHVSEHAPLVIASIEVASLAEAQTQAEALARTPFDLTRDPVLRVCTFRVHDSLHVLTMIVHHIAADGLSMDVMLDEMFARYEAGARDQGTALPAPSLSYADYAAWQRATLQLAPIEAAVQYWKTRLTGAPALLALPTDKPRPPRRSFRGTLVKRQLPPALLATLDGFGREQQATRYMTLLAAFYTLLARSSGESDICVGTPVGGRTHAQTERMIGTFVNMLVMRADVGLERSFVDLLGRVREQVLEAFEHQAAPFERVVEAVAPSRSQAHSPLFQVMFDYQAIRNLRPRVADLDVEPLLLSRGASQYDLSFSVLDSGQATHLHVEYRSDLFEDQTVQRFAERFVALLESALLEPQKPVGELPWLLANERTELLALGRGPTPTPGSSGVFLDAFEAHVAAHPEARAAADEHTTLSYTELDARANRLAQHLLAQGVGPDVAVGVYLDRNVNLLVALLAVLKAGGFYVPLDPVYPTARIALVLEDAAPRALITETSLRASLPDHTAALVVLDQEQPHVDTLPATAPERSALTSEHLAYVIFTSGSTGRPKGVEVSHGALANFLRSMAREPGLAANDLLLAVTTVSFDIAGLELFLPLTVGAHVEIAARVLAADGVRLAGRLARGDVTCLQATPATYRMLLEAGFTHAAGLKLLCGGEALPRDLAEALLVRSGSLYNMYGPTETTIWSACARVTPGNGAVPLGGPIDHTTLYVLDPRREPVPRGVAGELCIGGAGVARGYHKRPDLTEERFVPDPFEGGQARMYRTGDAARFRADGSLEFIGRIDQQVKLRGFRVELGEIESQISALPSVEACAVKVFEVAAQDARLVAYVVKRGTNPLEPAALRAALRQQLPEYMVPSVYVELAALPLTPNGKVDRKALPVPDFGAQSARSYQAPRDEIEAMLCGVFEAVLSHRPIGISENFFDLGGHSILAVRLFEQLYARTGQRLPLSTLFEAATVTELAALLRARVDATPDPRAAYLVPLVSGEAQTSSVFFVHPQGTGERRALEWYRPLAAALGVPAAALGCDEDAYQELHEVAARHAAALLKHAPRRRYRLVGLGLGGNLAQEIAVQLEERGAHVDLVIALQSQVPAQKATILGAYLSALPANLRRGLTQLKELSSEERAARWLLWVRAARSALTRNGMAALPALEDPVDQPALPAAYRMLSGPQWNALLRHTPRPCQAPIALVRGHRVGLKPLDEAQGFAGLSTSNVSIHVLDISAGDLVSGNHVPALTGAVRNALAQASHIKPTPSTQTRASKRML